MCFQNSENIFLVCWLNFIGFNELQLSYDKQSILKQWNLANVESHTTKIQNSNIEKGVSLNPSKSKNFQRSYELEKSEDSEQNRATFKTQHSSVDMHLRRDVVNKTIIRAFNKFYIIHFKSKLNFNNKTRDFLYSSLWQKVNRKITSLTSFHKYFGKIDNNEFEGKLRQMIKIFWI